jgi:hypothetical protein
MAWFFILKEVRRLMVFENKVLRRMFGQKWDEVIGGWQKFHNEILQKLYSSPNILRVMKSKGNKMKHA